MDMLTCIPYLMFTHSYRSWGRHSHLPGEICGQNSDQGTFRPDHVRFCSVEGLSLTSFVSELIAYTIIWAYNFNLGETTLTKRSILGNISWTFWEA